MFERFAKLEMEVCSLDGRNNLRHALQPGGRSASCLNWKSRRGINSSDIVRLGRRLTKSPSALIF